MKINLTRIYKLSDVKSNHLNLQDGQTAATSSGSIIPEKP